MSRCKKIIILIIMILLITSCTIQPPNSKMVIENANESENNTSSQDDLTLKIAAWMYHDIKSNIKWSEELKPLFEKYSLESVETSEKSYDEYYNNLIFEMLVGTYDKDIYFILADKMDIYPILANGYYVDLSSHMSDEFDLMFEGVREASMYKDDYFGLPITYLTPYYVFNLDRLNEVGINPNDVNTLNDLFWVDAIYRNKKDSKGASFQLYDDHLPNICFINPLNNNFDKETHYIDFDNIDLVELKELYKNLQTGVLDIRDYLIQRENDYLIYESICADRLKPNNYLIKPLFETENQKSNNMRICYYLINPYSTKIDLAKEFLRDYSNINKMDRKPDELYDLSSEVLYKDN